MICLIDTSVFCNLVQVPNKCDKQDQVFSDFKEYIELGTTFLLPMATIIETGNHIAQNGNGYEKREAGTRFIEQVRGAVNGKAPWRPTPFWSAEQLIKCLDVFPDYAQKGIGLGDLSIIEEFHKLCRIHPNREILIWSYDSDLKGYHQKYT